MSFFLNPHLTKSKDTYSFSYLIYAPTQTKIQRWGESWVELLLSEPELKREGRSPKSLPQWETEDLCQLLSAPLIFLAFRGRLSPPNKQKSSLAAYRNANWIWIADARNKELCLTLRVWQFLFLTFAAPFMSLLCAASETRNISWSVLLFMRYSTF